MTKTIKEWLSELPEPYRTKAIENCKASERVRPSSLKEALCGAFSWLDTPQGYDYWAEVYKRAEAGEFDRKPTTMKKQTKKRVKKPTRLDRIEADLKTLSAIVEGMKQPKDEAKESVAKEPEPWKPKVGDWVTLIETIGYGYSIGDTVKVKRVDGDGDAWVNGNEDYPRDVCFMQRRLRSATPEEIAAAEAKEKERAKAEKLSKLKFGVRVNTWDGEGVYWYSSHISKDEHRVVFHGGGLLVLKLSDITIVE